MGSKHLLLFGVKFSEKRLFLSAIISILDCNIQKYENDYLSGYGPRFLIKYWVGNLLSFRMHYRKSQLSHSFTGKIALLYKRLFKKNF